MAVPVEELELLADLGLLPRREVREAEVGLVAAALAVGRLGRHRERRRVDARVRDVGPPRRVGLFGAGYFYHAKVVHDFGGAAAARCETLSKADRIGNLVRTCKWWWGWEEPRPQRNFLPCAGAVANHCRYGRIRFTIAYPVSTNVCYTWDFLLKS